MKKLSKSDIARRAEIATKLAEALSAVEDEHNVLQEAMNAYNAKVADYNEALAEANGFVEDIANEIQSYMDDRSEKWHEGDTGEMYATWVDGWTSYAPEDMDEGEMPPLPSPSDGDDLEALAESPDEA